MKMLKLVLVITICVTLSTAYYEPRYPGMVHAASPRSGYKQPDQQSFTFPPQPPETIPADILEKLQKCANQQCESKYTLLCQIATAMKLRPYIYS